MIRYPEEVAALERRWARKSFANLSYRTALARFVALWNHARRLNPDFPSDWRSDVEADVTLARVLNALPPAA